MKVYASRMYDRYMGYKDVYKLELYPETDFEREVLEMFAAFYARGAHWDTIYKIYRDDIKMWGYVVYFPLEVGEEYLEELRRIRKDLVLKEEDC